MIVDTLAIIAIALQEPGWKILHQQATSAPELFMSLRIGPIGLKVN
jgi:uncharacterized protein with PIN domain